MATEHFAEMTPEEQQHTGQWFGTTKAELVGLASDLKSAADAAPENEKVDWLRQQGRVVGRISLLDSALEALDADTMVMAPPDPPLIAATVAAAHALGIAIANATRADAVVHLVDDLFAVIDKVFA